MMNTALNDGFYYDTMGEHYVYNSGNTKIVFYTLFKILQVWERSNVHHNRFNLVYTETI
jgi:hypothetical protein